MINFLLLFPVLIVTFSMSLFFTIAMILYRCVESAIFDIKFKAEKND